MLSIYILFQKHCWCWDTCWYHSLALGTHTWEDAAKSTLVTAVQPNPKQTYQSITLVPVQRMYFKVLPAESPIALKLRRKQSFSAILRAQDKQQATSFQLWLTGLQAEALAAAARLSLLLNSSICSFSERQQFSTCLKGK